MHLAALHPPKNKPLTKSLLFLVITFLVNNPALAKQDGYFIDMPLKPWRSQVPSAYEPVNNQLLPLANMADIGAIIYPHSVKTVTVMEGKKNNKKPVKKTVNFISSAVILNTMPNKVKTLLSNYTDYPKLFPKLVSAKTLTKKDNLTRMKYRAVIDIPVPVLKFDKEFIFRHQLHNNSLETWIDYSPVRTGMGKFQWYGINHGKYKGKTLLTLTQWGDLDDMRGFALPRIMKAMPELKMSIPSGVNAYVMEAVRLHFNGKDKPKSYTQKHVIPEWKIAPKNKATLQALLKNTDTFPILFAHPPRTLKNQTTLRFVSSLQTMPATANKVNSWLLNANQYPQLFKQVKKVTITPQQKNGVKGEEVTSKISVGLGVISIPFQTKLFFNKPTKNSAYFYATGGDVRWVQGKFETIASKTANKSYLKTTFASKTDKKAPFLLRIGHALPYHDYLGSVGTAPLLSYKVKQKLK